MAAIPPDPLSFIRGINATAAFNRWSGIAVAGGEEKLVATGETLLTPVGSGATLPG